jgi:CheY-like chemotaxis protein
VPIVAVTAYDDAATLQQCIEIGMKTVMQKPVSTEKLDRVMQSFYYRTLEAINANFTY